MPNIQVYSFGECFASDRSSKLTLISSDRLKLFTNLVPCIQDLWPSLEEGKESFQEVRGKE